jgi:hypothetical protein
VQQQCGGGEIGRDDCQSMNMGTDTTRSLASDRVYRQQWTATPVFIAISIVILMVMPPADDLFISIPYLLMVAILIFPMLYNRVIVSETGLKVFRVGFVYSTSWDNIESIAKVQIGLKHGFVLLLRQPAMKANRWLAWRTDEATWMERQGQFVPLERAIPLFLIIPNWVNGELGQDIRRYAPHVFAKATQG